MCIGTENGWTGEDPRGLPAPLRFEAVKAMTNPATGDEYLRGETTGRRYYSADGGTTWHRTLARALRGDRRGRAGTWEGREARGGEA